MPIKKEILISTEWCDDCNCFHMEILKVYLKDKNLFLCNECKTIIREEDADNES
jgi:hypothetical protein